MFCVTDFDLDFKIYCIIKRATTYLHSYMLHQHHPAQHKMALKTPKLNTEIYQ